MLSWFKAQKVNDAKVMVVGVGALGNEVLKNLLPLVSQRGVYGKAFVTRIISMNYKFKTITRSLQTTESKGDVINHVFPLPSFRPEHTERQRSVCSGEICTVLQLFQLQIPPLRMLRWRSACFGRNDGWQVLLPLVSKREVYGKAFVTRIISMNYKFKTIKH